MRRHILTTAKHSFTAVLRLCVAGLAVYFLTVGIGPMIFSGVQHVGTIVCVALGALLGFVAVWAPFCRRVLRDWWRVRWKRAALCAAGVLAAAGLVVCGVMSGLMIAAANRVPQGSDLTVVVLGAGINGDRPSAMLADRLTAAADYLKAHPASSCIVSGGRGTNERHTEADVMAAYLEELGIEPERIYREEESRNTQENLAYSLALARKAGLPTDIVVVTQEFHQYRGQQYAKEAGFTEVYALSCDTSSALLPGYVIREWIAILKMWIVG